MIRRNKKIKEQTEKKYKEKKKIKKQREFIKKNIRINTTLNKTFMGVY